MDYQNGAQRLADAIRRAQRVMLRDIMQGENGVLANLMISDDGMFSGELSEAMQLSRGRTSNAIKSLEQKGYLIRTVDAADFRRVRVCLTESGRAYAQEQYESVIANTVQLLQRLGSEDADAFVRIMERIGNFAESEG